MDDVQANLQEIANQAIHDLGNYNAAALTVADDETKLASDKEVAGSASLIAKQSATAARDAFDAALASIPDVPVPAPDPTAEVTSPARAARNRG